MIVTVVWKCGRCGSDAKANAYRGVVLRNEPSSVEVDLGRVDLNCPNCVGDAVELRRQNAIDRGLRLNAEMDVRRLRADLLSALRLRRPTRSSNPSLRWRLIYPIVNATWQEVIEIIEAGQDEL